MGLIGKIFGSDKTIEKGLDLVDNAFYTAEEKGAAHMRLLELYEPFKVIQRYLALIFSIPFALLHFGMYSFRAYSWDNEMLQKAIKLIQDDMNESLGLIVLTMVGFYFAGGMAEGMIKRFRSKK